LDFLGIGVAGISGDLFYIKYLELLSPPPTVSPEIHVTDMGSGFLTWGPERKPRMGKGDGCDSFTRFVLVDESGFPRETYGIIGELARISPEVVASEAATLSI
jgi:hypothetical protein